MLVNIIQAVSKNAKSSAFSFFHLLQAITSAHFKYISKTARQKDVTAKFSKIVFLSVITEQNIVTWGFNVTKLKHKQKIRN